MEDWTAPVPLRFAMASDGRGLIDGLISEALRFVHGAALPDDVNLVTVTRPEGGGAIPQESVHGHGPIGRRIVVTRR